MSLSQSRAELEPMDPQITSIQPGGGVCMNLELAWGGLRRWFLKTFCKGYVARMAACRKGTTNPCPFEVLDPRDLKFYQNQGGYYWEPADDPFQWRNRLPFARAGLTELWVLTTAFWMASSLVGWGATLVPAPISWILRLLSLAGIFCGSCIIWFFRNPRRTPPTDPNVFVSPADGTLVHIEEIAHDEYIGGPAVLIGIFLSVFNVHINRVPMASRIIGLRYRKGKFLNALKPASAQENEQLAVRLEQTSAPYRRAIVRQIAGAIARRIVCWIKPGDELAAGAQFGMIKLGSRTELVLPREEGLEIVAQMGQKVIAGETVLVRFRPKAGS